MSDLNLAINEYLSVPLSTDGKCICIKENDFLVKKGEIRVYLLYYNSDNVPRYMVNGISHFKKRFDYYFIDIRENRENIIDKVLDNE